MATETGDTEHDHEHGHPGVRVSCDIMTPQGNFDAGLTVAAEHATIPGLANALVAAARGVSSSYNPMLLEMYNSLIIDTAAGAMLWVNADAGPVADAPLWLTDRGVDQVVKSHYQKSGMRAEALRFHPGGHIVPIAHVRAVLRAAGAR